MHFPQIVYKLSKAKFSHQKSFAQFVDFLRKVCFIIQKLKNKHIFLKKYTNLQINLIEQEEKNTKYLAVRSVAYFQLVIDFLKNSGIILFMGLQSESGTPFFYNYHDTGYMKIHKNKVLHFSTISMSPARSVQSKPCFIIGNRNHD